MPGPVGIETSVGPSGRGSSYDADAQDYFSRREALGGSFASASHTASTTKAAFNDFYVSAKDLDFYDEITEIYWLIGGSFTGLMAKGKFVTNPLTTNVNFLAADFVGSGAGAGLKGNASNKRVDTGLNAIMLPLSNVSYGCYVTAGATVTSGLIGNSRSGSGDSFNIAEDVSLDTFFARINSGAGITLAKTIRTGDVTVRRSGTSTAIDHRQTIGLNSTSTAGSTGADPISIFGRGNTLLSDARISAAWLVGDGSSALVTNLHLRTNALMTALGANTY